MVSSVEMMVRVKGVLCLMPRLVWLIQQLPQVPYCDLFPKVGCCCELFLNGAKVTPPTRRHRWRCCMKPVVLTVVLVQG